MSSERQRARRRRSFGLLGCALAAAGFWALAILGAKELLGG